MKFKTTILLVIFASVAVLSACGDSSDNPSAKGNSTGHLSDAQKANLYDKVWYAQGSAGGLDLEFLSDGEFRQAKSLPGTWEWQNNGDTMNIVDYNNSSFNFLFDEITSTTMKYRSNWGGDNYQTVITYATSK